MNAIRFFFRRHRLSALGAIVGALWLGPASHVLAQVNTTTTGSAAQTMDSADRKFIGEAAQGGMAEVAMGQMAQQRGNNAQVKAFGQRMVQDHTKANEDLKRIATGKGLQLPTTLGSEHQHHADQFAKLSGADFDRAYMKHMLEDHKKDVSDFEKASKSAKDGDVKDFAGRTLPTLQSHLQLAQTTYDQVK
jgi:putative membrane protein